MILGLFLFFLHVSVAFAQTALTNPISAMTAHLSQDGTLNTGSISDSWEVELQFAFDKTTAPSIKSGDYFDFSIQGSLAPRTAAAKVPYSYDFFIESQNGQQLFHVLATDDLYNFRATATSFFDNPPAETFDLAGKFSVDFLLSPTIGLGNKAIQVGAFSSTVTVVDPVSVVVG